MKKAMFVIVAAMFMAACGGQGTATKSADSTSVDSSHVDSAAVAPVNDSVASLKAPADTLF